MVILEQIKQIQSIVPTLKLLTKPINSTGDYIFFSHISFDDVALRYNYIIYLARKELNSNLKDIIKVLNPLINLHSELFTLKKMKPIPIEGLFVVYELNISVSEKWSKDIEWIT